MRYGAIIETGAQAWQIFQQGAQGGAAICLAGRYTVTRLSSEVPFTFSDIKTGGVRVRARVVCEASGRDILPWQECLLLGGLRWETCLENVPTGGLYRIETCMEYDGWDGLSVTRGDMVHHIGVGDVFVVAGQSNACGRAKTPIEDAPRLGVHIMRPSGRWDLATHPLGETTDAVYTGHFENHNPGHTPFLHMAKRLHSALGYPIGIVMTAHGGTPLRWWNPAENGALTDNMLSMLNENEIKPRAMLWYQGEAEAYEDGSKDYLERFTQFVVAVREGLGDAGLPVFTVQLNRCMNDETEELDRHWGRVRQAQRDAMYSMENVYTVPANDLPLYDFVHIAPEGNLRLAERLADAVLGVLHGQNINWRAPEIISAEVGEGGEVHVRFDGIQNWLDVYSLPPALMPIEAEDAEGIVKLKAYVLERDGLRLTFERELAPGAVLHGAWRMNPGAGVPQDCMRMPMLSFYGFAIKGLGQS